MNIEELQNFGKYFAEKATAIRQELESTDELVTELDKLIMETLSKTEKPTEQEINSLKCVDKTSEKGPYQTTSKTDNQDNPAFQKLQKYIAEHNGFVILHGFKLWQFSNNPEIIGRRKK